MGNWLADERLESWVTSQGESALGAYTADPLLIEEHANQEESFRTGGYASRQVLELVQNAADAILKSGGRGKVALVLTDSAFYCANEGLAFDEVGLNAITHAFVSGKRGEEIGRFGLGFKSVLGVSDSPHIYSRSISVKFDRQLSKSLLAAVEPEGTVTPLLRIPWLENAERAAACDPELRGLMEWATTVVKLPLNGSNLKIRRDLENLRTEFLLFVPSVSELSIDIRDAAEVSFHQVHTCREIETGLFEISKPDGGTTQWHVSRRRHKPSALARMEIGDVIVRDEITVSYAAPAIGGSGGRGEFWAYFPLKDATTAKGIFNAPWRINDDRTSLLSGVFNDEILDVCAALLLTTVPQLSTADDPARHFDYMPARGREAQSDADRHLSTIVPELARQVAFVPDTQGTMVRASMLRSVSLDHDLDGKTIGLWQSSLAAPNDFPHWSCYSTATRRARLSALIRGDREIKSPKEVVISRWLEMLTRSKSSSDCAIALRIISHLTDAVTRKAAVAAKIIPDSANEMHRADAVKSIFLGGTSLTSMAGIAVVNPSFLVVAGVELALRELGFTDVRPADELMHVTNRISSKWTSSHWQQYWNLVLDVPHNDATKTLADHHLAHANLKVLTASGCWSSASAVIAPGWIDPVDPSLVLDRDFFEDHSSVLSNLGVTDRPTAISTYRHDFFFKKYERSIRERLIKDRLLRRNYDGALFANADGLAPLFVLQKFRDTGDLEAATAWTTHLLRQKTELRWYVALGLNSGVQPIPVAAPHMAAVEELGVHETVWGKRPTDQCVSAQLIDFALFLPVIPATASRELEIPHEINEVGIAIWREFLVSQPQEADPWKLGELLAAALSSDTQGELDLDVVPAVLGQQCTLTRGSGLYVATDQQQVEALQKRSLPFVACRSSISSEALVHALQCSLASDVMRSRLEATDVSEPTPVYDKFRSLRPFPQVDGISLIACRELVYETSSPIGLEADSVSIGRDNEVIFHVENLEDSEILRFLSASCGLGLNTTDIDRVLEQERLTSVSEKIEQSRMCTTDAERLRVLVAKQALTRVLPTELVNMLATLGQPDHEQDLATLAIHVHGFAVLERLKTDLVESGLPVPERWASSPAALAFVHSLGFAPEYAGEKMPPREPFFDVLGKPGLGDLHEYQQNLANQVRTLVSTNGRALLFLPTGAGKTRVATEAVVRSFVEDGLLGHVVWIAQSDELCEQAVESWTEVWRQFGDHRPLRIGRLWGGRNEVPQYDTDLAVIVCTEAKLVRALAKESYDWLRNASLIVVDEAHLSLGKEYTEILDRFGIGARRNERPLLGLTATPFKGQSDTETRRLVMRYGGNKLDALGNDPYRKLQDLGVLSLVEHRVLDGVRVKLSDSDLDQLQQKRLIPTSVLDDLGRDQQRTKTLLEDILSLPDDWPTLVFTASVTSAHVLAALLNSRGISAASVSGETGTHERRRKISDFKAGAVRVLVNCNLLTQGFDAPGVRALYIAKPTFSPNSYIQMVGRALRGPQNGGSRTCLIVNIQDTFDRFGEDLAFRRFDHLWDNHGSAK